MPPHDHSTVSPSGGAPYPNVFLRRSSRLKEKAGGSKQTRSLHHSQLPSPRPSCSPPTHKAAQKRSLSTEAIEDADRGPKRLQTARILRPPLSTPSRDPVAYWAATSRWPKSVMSRPESTLVPSSKRRSSSRHHSDKRKKLEENGIYMKGSVLLKKESKQFCERLCTAEQDKPAFFPCYPASKLDNVIERAHEVNEARLQRDIMPWVVPSAENLHLSGIIDRDYIGEEVDTEWIRCETMGSSRPKPDFTAGLKRCAFSPAEDNKLNNYATAQRPYLFTPDLAFPFLMCEAKTGRAGLDTADTQNAHSASIAARAILNLYISTFGRDHKNTQELLGRVLVFTVSHNNRVVNVYGHYAVSNGMDSGDAFTFFRHDIAMFSLTMYEGKERFSAYNFAKQLYDVFAPVHFQRIREAVRAMPEPAIRTGLSFATSDIMLEDEDSQQDSAFTSQEDQAFKAPSEPASALVGRELASVRARLDSVLQQMQEERAESRRREEALERKRDEAVKQEREESRRREEAGRRREEALERRLDELLKVVTKSTT